MQWFWARAYKYTLVEPIQMYNVPKEEDSVKTTYVAYLFNSKIDADM